MKGLFLVFHGFSAHSGISKKIFAQCEALCQNGIDTELCHLQIDPDGTQRRVVGNHTIHTFGKGLFAKIAKRIGYADLTDYIRREQIELLYIRHDLNANPFLVAWLRKMHRRGVRIALEIPTYPYDAEFRQSSRKDRLQLRIDQLFRHSMARQIDRIVTFSEDRQIFGASTVCISNGIDFNQIPLKTELHDTASEVHLLAIANIHPWHGFDRAIEGLGNYYTTPKKRIVRLRIVGDGYESILAHYRQLIAQYSIGEYVEIAGPHAGAALDTDFAWCDLGIASLARHRSGITHLKSLKNREYAARGIPFVYSEIDTDFEAMPYIHKAPATDSPLDIAALLNWFDGIDRTPAAIRSTIDPALSWQHQMRQVVEQVATEK